MDYKQKYEDALNRAKSYKGLIAEMGIVFPELKESEDERIRKNMREFLLDAPSQDIVNHHLDLEETLAWLEKQGEQKTADKVEPKFKVGDFIINEYGFIMQIDGIDGNMYVYHVLDNNHLLKHDITQTDESCHLWTIQNAKKGDILQANKCILIFDSLTKDIDGNTVISSWYYCDTKTFYGMGTSKPDLWDIEGVAPATKEQRNLLFQKMKEAGYELDGGKKELRKIELAKNESEEELSDFEAALFSAFSDAWQQYLHGEEVDMAQWAKEHSAGLLEAAKEKPAEWSKEDETMYNVLCSIVHNTYIVHRQETIDKLLSWLKSIKQQTHWKPSEEQMIYLKKVYETYDFCDGERCALESLYNDLKEL